MEQTKDEVTYIYIAVGTEGEVLAEQDYDAAVMALYDTHGAYPALVVKLNTAMLARPTIPVLEI